MKILVIGSRIKFDNGTDISVRSFAWEDARKINNFGDYDRVVLLCDSLPEPIDEDVFGIGEVLNMENLCRLVFHDGHLIVIGDHTRKFVHSRVPNARSIQYSRRTSIAELLRLGVFFETNPGSNAKRTGYKAVPNELSPYSNYTDQLVSWDQALTRQNPDLEGYAEKLYEHMPGLNRSWQFRFEVHMFVTNRHNLGIAAAYMPTIEVPEHWNEDGMRVTEAQWHLGAVAIFPCISNDTEGTIRAFLESVWGIQGQTPEPSWTQDIVAPGQQSIDDAMEISRARVNQLVDQLEDLGTRRKKTRGALRLLFAQGTDLEEAVDMAFQQIGGELVKQEVANRTDSLIRWKSDEGEEYFAIEVKGTSKSSFEEKGLRQLNEWTMDCVETLGQEVKGIFLGNSQINEQPTQRTNPFGTNFLRTAVGRNYGVLLSQDLYEVLEQYHSGDIDPVDFFTMLQRSTGLINVKSLFS